MHTIKKLMQNRRTEKGFTLVEVIVTITVFAILASFFVTFMGTAITKSSDPVTQARNLGAASVDMETITAAYECYLSKCTTDCWCCHTTEAIQCPPGPCTCNWDTFKHAVGCDGTTCTVPITSTSGSTPTFETIQVTITKANQTIVAYFMQVRSGGE